MSLKFVVLILTLNLCFTAKVLHFSKDKLVSLYLAYIKFTAKRKKFNVKTKTHNFKTLCTLFFKLTLLIFYYYTHSINIKVLKQFKSPFLTINVNQ